MEFSVLTYVYIKIKSEKEKDRHELSQKSATVGKIKTEEMQ